SGDISRCGNAFRAVDGSTGDGVASGDPDPVRPVEAPEVVEISLRAELVDAVAAEEPEIARSLGDAHGHAPAAGDIRRGGHSFGAVDGGRIDGVRPRHP